MKLSCFLLATSLLFIDPVASVKDFKPAFGKWKGTLTYLDYTSGKPYTMPCNITVAADKTNTKQLVYIYEYPDEPKANGNDTLVVSEDGKNINGYNVVSKSKENGLLKIITEKNGVDGNDNRKAVLRYSYSIGKRIFSKRKEVKFEGETSWVLRNEYKMSR